MHRQTLYACFSYANFKEIEYKVMEMTVTEKLLRPEALQAGMRTITYAVSTDLKRALAAKGFVFGMAGMMLMIMIASIGGISEHLSSPGALPAGFHAKLILDALTSDDVTLALPVLCTLPFTTAFVDDIKSGYIKEYLPRCGVGDYIRGKLIACGVSGGLTLAAGVFAAYALSALVFLPMELVPDPKAAIVPYFAQICTKALIVFLTGAFWSLTGFTLASLTMSKYMAYASPFVLYYVLIILHERYFEDFYVLYPKEWLAQTQVWVLDYYGIVVLLLALSAVMCLIFIIAARRRLENG